jgi:hypothetical protein
MPLPLDTARCNEGVCTILYDLRRSPTVGFAPRMVWRRVQVARSRPVRILTYMVKYILGFYRAGCACVWRAVLIRTPRRAFAVEIMFYFCRAVAAWIYPLGIAERWHRNLPSLAKEQNPGREARNARRYASSIAAAHKTHAGGHHVLCH